MKEGIPLQSNTCKNFPSSSSCEHLKATLEIEAFKQIRQETAHPEENVHENEQLHHTRPQKHTCISYARTISQQNYQVEAFHKKVSIPFPLQYDRNEHINKMKTSIG
jgi:hypothetical protein